MNKADFEAKVRELYPESQRERYGPEDPEHAHSELDKLCWQALKELGYFDVKAHVSDFNMWYA